MNTLKRRRIDAGLSPEALAEAIVASGAGKISGRAIRRLEDASDPRPRASTLKLLADHFGLKPSELLEELRGELDGAAA